MEADEGGPAVSCHLPLNWWWWRINSSDKVCQASIASLKLHRLNIFIHHCRDSFSPAIIRDDPLWPTSINPAGAHQADGGLSVESNYTSLLLNGWRSDMETNSLKVLWADISVFINLLKVSALRSFVQLFTTSTGLRRSLSVLGCPWGGHQHVQGLGGLQLVVVRFLLFGQRASAWWWWLLQPDLPVWMALCCGDNYLQRCQNQLSNLSAFILSSLVLFLSLKA